MNNDLFSNAQPAQTKKPKPEITKPSEFKQHTAEFDSAKKSKVSISSPMAIAKGAVEAIKEFINSFEAETPTEAKKEANPKDTAFVDKLTGK